MTWNKIVPIQTIYDEFDLLNSFKQKSIISLIGGEPTLHPRFTDILVKGLELHHHVHVYTNGTSHSFEKYDVDVANKYLWTFSYHGGYTKDIELFKSNMLWFLNNDIPINLTIPAQNCTSDIIEFCKKWSIDTAITFIHDCGGHTNTKKVINKVKNIKGDHITNYSEYWDRDLSFRGMLCEYGEINILNSTLTSNECNQSLFLPINYIHNLPKSQPTICDFDLCKRDCAHIIPRKYANTITIRTDQPKQ